MPKNYPLVPSSYTKWIPSSRTGPWIPSLAGPSSKVPRYAICILPGCRSGHTIGSVPSFRSRKKARQIPSPGNTPARPIWDKRFSCAGARSTQLPWSRIDVPALAYPSFLTGGQRAFDPARPGQRSYPPCCTVRPGCAESASPPASGRLPSVAVPPGCRLLSPAWQAAPLGADL